CSKRSLLQIIGLIHLIKRKGLGRQKESQVVRDPRLRYGLVIVQRVKGRLVALSRRVIFGVEELIPLKQISTSLFERFSGTLRHHVTPLRRKTRRLAKHRTAIDTQAKLFKGYYNRCRKQDSLKGKTPAQAAGLTDRSWTLRKLLTFNAATTSRII